MSRTHNLRGRDVSRAFSLVEEKGTWRQKFGAAFTPNAHDVGFIHGVVIGSRLGDPSTLLRGKARWKCEVRSREE